MKIVFLPIDNRPVCYQMPAMIAKINKSVELVLPPIELLGGLKQDAQVDRLFEWLEKYSTNADSIIMSLDTLLYGGLIPSRRGKESFQELKTRVEKIEKILRKTNARVYAFSSVMRISNNNINEEEKEYWNLYGEKIFKYSYNVDKSGAADTDVPEEIIQDYLATRKRNFEINKLYLALQKEGLFDTLIFSKDDCAEYGLNVREARELEALGGFTKTGADEIPLSLLASAIKSEIMVFPIFLEPEYKHLISNYEDVSIEKSVLGQLELAGCSVSSKEDADVLLFVNNFKDKQGEIVMKRTTELFQGQWIPSAKSYALADVRLANGADNNFVNQIFKNSIDEKFLGYAAWNTSANTLGSLICTMKFALTAKKQETFDEGAFKLLEVVRFLDDWAYQANVRQNLNKPDVEVVKLEMLQYENLVKDYLKIDFKAEYSFPWDRLFEVKIELN